MVVVIGRCDGLDCCMWMFLVISLLYDDGLWYMGPCDVEKDVKIRKRRRICRFVKTACWLVMVVVIDRCDGLDCCMWMVFVILLSYDDGLCYMGPCDEEKDVTFRKRRGISRIVKPAFCLVMVVVIGR